METYNFLSKDQLLAIDLINVVNGGISLPHVNIIDTKSIHKVEISVPGLDNRRIKVEVNNGKILIYFILDIMSDNFNKKESQINMIINSHELPSQADIKNMRVEGTRSYLDVLIPFISGNGDVHSGKRRRKS